MFHLVVTSKFDAYLKGSMITDPALVAKILADPRKRRNVVKISAPAATAAKSTAATVTVSAAKK